MEAETQVANTPTIRKLAIIWLHGQGGKGEKWMFIRAQLKFSVPTKWVFPDAPVVHQDGATLTSWFNVERIPIDRNARDFPEDLAASVQVRLVLAVVCLCVCLSVG
jgi:predicted esterase